MRDPWLRFVKRMIEIHPSDTYCATCDEPAPCDTMRALWIYDLERKNGAA